MADLTAPAAPRSGARQETELNLLPLSPGTTLNGLMSEAVHNLRFEAVNKYADGLTVPVRLVVNLDNTGRPINPGMIYDASTGTYEAPRATTSFKTAVVTSAGAATVWTPASGKSIHLQGYSWSLGSVSTTAAGTVITLQDNTTDIINVVAMGTTTGAVSGFVAFPNNGIKLAADHVLKTNNTGAISGAGGGLIITFWGYEE